MDAEAGGDELGEVAFDVVVVVFWRRGGMFGEREEVLLILEGCVFGGVGGVG